MALTDLVASSALGAKDLILREQRWLDSLLHTIFLGGQVIVHLLQGRLYPAKLLDHMALVGPNSLAAVLLINFCSAVIFVFQTGTELARFGAVDIIGGSFAVAFFRELSPVLSASIVAGQVASAFAAEIGSMQVTHQIDALKMLKTDPIDYLVLPRVVAAFVMLPVVIIPAVIMGLIGGIFTASTLYHVPPIAFLDAVRSALSLVDLFSLLLKGFTFGIVIGVVGCACGLTPISNVRGVGEATTLAVVIAWVLIFVVDLLLSLMIFRY